MKKISAISSSDVKNNPATAAVLYFPKIHRDLPGSLAWLRGRGLLFPSDLAREYEGIREPRGEYFVSLPEDLE
ncbi:MAG: hypothetical protein ACH255_06520 [Candidatus Thiodiazotropha sp.]